MIVRHYKSERARQAAITSLARIGYNLFQIVAVSRPQSFALLYGLNYDNVNEITIIGDK